MSTITARHPAALITASLGVASAVLAAMLLATPLSELLSASVGENTGYDPQRMVLLHATLPRMAMAILCGAGLACAGAILQQVLGNPLASPTTLGVTAGARLALAFASVYAPSLIGFGRDLVALVGSALSTGLVFLLVRRRGFSPLALVLAGLIVSLYCGALSTILMLVKDRFLVSLFIWGSGSLSQQSWGPSLSLAWRLALSLVPLVLLLRPLALLELGDGAARSLGISVERVRAGGVAVAVALSAFVTSAVGAIGFIGLAAPILVRLAGVHAFGARLVWSAAIGALLLLVVDLGIQLFAANSAFLPAGAVTAVLGSPLLLALLPRLKTTSPPPSIVPAASTRVRRSLAPPIAIGLAVTVALAAIAMILVGRGVEGGWQLLAPATWAEVLPWRVPRAAAAAGAGALLATAGFCLQRLTGNPMASPEILGVSAGAMLGVAVALYLVGSVGTLGQSAAAALGGLAVLLLILALARRSAFAPERVLLAGVALTALIDAVVGVMTSTGDPRAVMLLAWLGGSTNGATPATAFTALIAAVVFAAVAVLLTRWLTMLPLGHSAARALGVPVWTAQRAVLVLAAVMTAVATPIIGPLTFVGLMAPHIVATAGIRRAAPSVLACALVGAALMLVADFLARTVAFPLQLPTGLVAALVAGPILMILLGRAPER